MHKKLLKDAFIKAEENIGSDKLTHLSNHLSDFIVEDSKEAYGEKILRVNYNKIINNAGEKIYLRAHAAESLSHYLGFSSYADFIKNNPVEKTTVANQPQSFSRKNKLILIIGLVLLFGVFVFNSATKQKWMVWQDDHYIEVDFDTETYNVNQLKIFKKERIESFKKITPTCDYPFFNQNGNVNLWYAKNRSKDLEYFTALGLHPETGKTLKPITKYMIDKHICKPRVSLHEKNNLNSSFYFHFS